MNGLGLGSEETQEPHGARAAVTRPRPRPRVHRQPLRQKEPYFLGTFLPSAQTTPKGAASSLHRDPWTARQAGFPSLSPSVCLKFRARPQVPLCFW